MAQTYSDLVEFPNLASKKIKILVYAHKR